MLGEQEQRSPLKSSGVIREPITVAACNHRRRGPISSPIIGPNSVRPDALLGSDYMRLDPDWMRPTRNHRVRPAFRANGCEPGANRRDVPEAVARAGDRE